MDLEVKVDFIQFAIIHIAHKIRTYYLSVAVVNLSVRQAKATNISDAACRCEPL